MQTRRKSKLKTIVGILFWVAAVSVAVYFGWSKFGEGTLLPRVSGYFGKRQHAVDLHSPTYQRLGFGDPIFVVDGQSATRVGNVAFIDFGEGYEKFKIGDTKTAAATLYGRCPPLEAGDYVEVHASDDSMEWVVRTMLPPESRARISALIVDAWKRNQKDLLAKFAPLIEDSIAEAGSIISEDLQVAIANHQAEIDAISNRFQDQLIQREIVPLVKSEIWPIVQEETQPLVETIGREVWQEVSVWRFGWRYLYDRSPLPDKQLTEKEFNRFVERKAVPILENHVDDFIDVQKQVLDRITKNETVRKTVSESVRQVTEDQDFRDLVASISKDVLVENSRLKEALRQNWSSPEARRAMEFANYKLDPTILQIGQSMFGSTKTAITPEFARVLRNKILHKDQRWLTLHTKSLGNRDEQLAAILIDAQQHESTDSNGAMRLPMVGASVVSDFPEPSATATKIEPPLRKVGSTD